ncbi:hypothetical protein HBI56_079680 [Parastagonospora nodorum]|uniref:DUF7730 domain-containing protein n=2 Tax=Phaeosphaeria nodorum (strain SN15 / ATCC MYA-4574 / FGSC 10173) TaxID=321614 RepID=A0A7U2FGK5_PHANO|nr:hypothetical protein HBH56_107120 [Parastagonospora nodorum]QRD04889.1 hypothetical protein JI435_108020 [Parastagonospora nodorum SN15]KAH3929359.1 hypothetical protein HBH54_123300 [Parastagonospora nodorum]KAH3951539.1 hypothetical protein HBH53_057300 [Parastagonospora nodorum]KAH3975604.1 hypothetical protein HBH52_129490 [Parastagonospora nodorum]
MSRLLTKLKKGIRKCKTICKQPVEACAFVLFFACLPCVLCLIIVSVGLKQRSKEKKRRNRSFRSDEMPQFPSPRPRALSLPLVHAQPWQRAFNQSQSAFMIMIPLEIRRMIYSYVLGGQVVHFWTWNGAPQARICWDKDGCNSDYIDWEYQRKGLRFDLALLRTCRSIYTEAVDYLYFANTFSIWNVDYVSPTIKLLSYYFLPQRLQLVRDLRIHWSFCPDSESWLEDWKAISKMKGLQRLHVTVTNPWLGRPGHSTDDTWRDKLTEIMAAVRNITAPGDFVLYVPDIKWLEWSADVDLGDSKCVFRMAEEPTGVSCIS